MHVKETTRHHNFTFLCSDANLSTSFTLVVMQRGKVPIVVGGTGFYLRWCLHGKPQTPSSTAQGVKRAQKFIEEVHPSFPRFNIKYSLIQSILGRVLSENGQKQSLEYALRWHPSQICKSDEIL